MDRGIEESSTGRIPILLIGYCRPFEMQRILTQIERLDPRNVEISIDGPTFNTIEENGEVLRISRLWAITSKHDVTVNKSDINLGLFAHFSLALGEFFSKYEIGLVLEDDMEFHPFFIEVLDSDFGRKMLAQHWSISGYNPRARRATIFNRGKKMIHFTETEIHTIWGWASSALNVSFFLEFSNKYRSDPESLNIVVQDFSSRITCDSLLAESLRSTWNGKIQRATMADKPNWDNFWVLAGWASGRTSLMPSSSLSCENPNSIGTSTHQGVRSTKLLQMTDYRLLPDIPTIKRSSRFDSKLLSVWGVTRLKAYRIFLIRSVIDRFKIRL